MIISSITKIEANASTLKSLEVDCAQVEGDANKVLMSQSLRRAIVFLAPCTKATLVSAVLDALAPILEGDFDDIRSQIIDSLDQLCMSGDILELESIESTESAPECKLWAATSSYVICPHGKILILGSDRDLITNVPDDLQDRVIYRGCDRFIHVGEGEGIDNILSDHGLFEVSVENWIKRPEIPLLEVMIGCFSDNLYNKKNDGEIEGLTILAEKGQYYHSRWREMIDNDNGIFVAKRSQKFITDRWCVVKINNGYVTHLYDLFSDNSTQRPCDRAWHFQCALSASADAPEVYKVSLLKETAIISFFFPIPFWAERQLLLSARRVECRGALMAFEMPIGILEKEENLLKQDLWMTQDKA